MHAWLQVIYTKPSQCDYLATYVHVIWILLQVITYIEDVPTYGEHDQNNAAVVHPITSYTDTQCSGFCYWCPLCQAHQ